MKHRGSSKIKHEHHMIKGLRELLEKIEVWDEIRSIIPAEIRRTKKSQPQIRLKVQHPTKTGLKCLAYSGGAVQEVFIVSTDPAGLQIKLEAL